MGTITRKLIPEMKEGDRQAFNEVFERYWRKLVRLAGKNVPAHVDAEGIAQSAAFSFWNAMTNKGGFPVLNDTHDLERILTWITVCKARDVVTAGDADKRKLTEIAVNDLIRIMKEPPTPADEAQLREVRAQFTAGLTSDENAVLALREQSQTFEEIAKKLDWPLNAVKAAMRQIQRKARKFFSAETGQITVASRNDGPE